MLQDLEELGCCRERQSHFPQECCDGVDRREGIKSQQPPKVQDGGTAP